MSFPKEKRNDSFLYAFQIRKRTRKNQDIVGLQIVENFFGIQKQLFHKKSYSSACFTCYDFYTMASLCWLKFQWTIHFEIFRFLTLVCFPNVEILFEEKWKMPLTKNCEYVGNKTFTSKKEMQEILLPVYNFVTHSIYFIPNITSHIF